MVDRALAGYGNVDTFTPDQLYAGEADTVTTQGTVAGGLVLPKYAVVMLGAAVGQVGQLVAWDGAGDPYGILPHAIDTSPTGYNAPTDTPVFVGGVFNFEALQAGGATYAALKEAFAVAGGNSNIVIQKLY